MREFLAPKSIDEVVTAVSQASQLRVFGGGSKTGLAYTPDSCTVLDLSGWHGVLEYEPGEFTFTALAGTPITDVKKMLAAQGQYLPFDPLLETAGATVGGTIAANSAGSGRYRYGGVRDFILGVRFVDGKGNLVRGGGKVVKNAAGFDLPKLMVGSLGRLGVLVEATFKVFPQPAAYATLKAEFPNLSAVLTALTRLTTSNLEADAVDVTPPGTLWVRLGGLPPALPARLDTLRRFLGSGDVLQSPEETAAWNQMQNFAVLPAGAFLVKVPVTPKRIPTLDAELQQHSADRRYSVGGQVAWVVWYNTTQLLHEILQRLELSGLVMVGSAVPHPLLGKQPDPIFWQRIQETFDPQKKFVM